MLWHISMSVLYATPVFVFCLNFMQGTKEKRQEPCYESLTETQLQHSKQHWLFQQWGDCSSQSRDRVENLTSNLAVLCRLSLQAHKVWFVWTDCFYPKWYTNDWISFCKWWHTELPCSELDMMLFTRVPPWVVGAQVKPTSCTPAQPGSVLEICWYIHSHLDLWYILFILTERSNFSFKIVNFPIPLIDEDIACLLYGRIISI